ncbi:MAG: hypothetical protein AAF958_00200 [Planctomycetota bacterium]
MTLPHSSRLGCKRPAFTLIEVMIAGGLLITGLSVVTMLAFRNSRQWQRLGHYQLALDELDRAVELLRNADPGQRQQVINDLRASSLAQDRLGECKLQAKVEEVNLNAADADDPRPATLVRLSFDWDRPGDPPPVQLSVWFAGAVE